jgi:hypothetical protein
MIQRVWYRRQHTSACHLYGIPTACVAPRTCPTEAPPAALPAGDGKVDVVSKMQVPANLLATLLTERRRDVKSSDAAVPGRDKL